MSGEHPGPKFLSAAGALRQAIKQRPYLLAMGGLALFLRKYGMLGEALAGAAVLATLLLGALAIADRISGIDSEAERRMKARNVAIALALAAMVVLFYVATMIRMGGNVLNRPL